MTKASVDYFNDVINAEEMKGDAKRFIKSLIQRQEWVIREIYTRMSPEGADILRSEMNRDIQAVDSIINLAIAMSEEQRAEYERIGEGLLNDTTT